MKKVIQGELVKINLDHLNDVQVRESDRLTMLQKMMEEIESEVSSKAFFEGPAPIETAMDIVLMMFHNHTYMDKRQKSTVNGCGAQRKRRFR